MKVLVHFNNEGVVEHDTILIEGENMKEINEKIKQMLQARNLTLEKHYYYSELLKD